VCVCARGELSLRAHMLVAGCRPLIKRAHASCDPSAIAGGQPAVERQKQRMYSILRPPSRGRCGSIAILCASPPVLVAPCRCAPTVMPTTHAILKDDGAPWWLSLCVMCGLIRASLSVCVVVGHLSLSRSFSHHASVSFMVVLFQVVLQLPRVPSVYVFVRTCVRARAAADAAVGLSKSCFHVPLCSTLLLLGRCRASAYSSSAPAGFFSASCVKTPARHTSMGERRVGWSQFTLIVIVC
jgi:hypothetical protein